MHIVKIFRRYSQCKNSAMSLIRRSQAPRCQWYCGLKMEAKDWHTERDIKNFEKNLWKFENEDFIWHIDKKQREERDLLVQSKEFLFAKCWVRARCSRLMLNAEIVVPKWLLYVYINENWITRSKNSRNLDSSDCIWRQYAKVGIAALNVRG